MRDLPAETILNACDRTFAIECSDDTAARLVRIGFGGLLRAPTASFSQQQGGRFRIEGDPDDGFRVVDVGSGVVSSGGPDTLVFSLDRQLILTLQRERPNLYFLHAGAVARNGQVVVLAGAAGAGKSTLTLALLQNGFSYLSDELAPLDPVQFRVHPYPHALCLKSRPPGGCRMPSGALVTRQRLHVPVTSLGSPAETLPLPLGAFFFLRRRATPVTCRSMTPAAAVVHLMANSLNAKAHPDDGLEAAISLAGRVPSYALDNSDLLGAVTAISTALDLPSARLA